MSEKLPAPTVTAAVSSDTSLMSFVNKTGSFVLNAKQELSNMLDGRSDTLVESDADEQLLATLAFREPVKCQRVLLTTTADDRAPKTIKIFVNRRSMDFGDAERDSATQTFSLELPTAPVKPEGSDMSRRVARYVNSSDGKQMTVELHLHFVHFQKVTELTFFVADNIGNAESTAIVALDVLSADKLHKHVEFVAGDKAFEALLIEAGEKTVFVDFTASWCGPCQRIAPTFQELAEATPSALFRKVDVDASKSVAQKYGVAAMPTFIVFKKGARVGELRGADEAALRELVAKHK